MRSFIALTAALFLTLTSFGARPAIAAVVDPVVTGPIAATATPGDPSHAYPFFASPLDLAGRGYVEEEYFFEGTATRYTVVGTAAGVPGTAHPYKTRMIVRRPASAERFTGTVIVEWLNVTNNADFENSWFQFNEHVLRSGWAWVGVSAQRVGVNRLRTWSPTRYGSLDVSGRVGTTETVTDDGLSYDIFSQAAQAIRHPVGVSPLGGLSAAVLIATGHSQSAMRLVSYANGIQPISHAFGAFAIHDSLGNAVRTDLEVPVWKVLSEYDVRLSEAAQRRPDSGLYKSWEVTGTSHNDRQSFSQRVFLQRRDLGVAGEDSLNCTFPLGTSVPFHYAFAAGLAHLDSWVRTGTVMPSAPWITTTGTSTIVRDSDGNGVGGLRLPQLDAPIYVSNGTNSGGGSCDRWGYTLPFTESRLLQLYPTHRDYVAKVTAAVNDAMARGVLLQADGEATIAAARNAPIPTPDRTPPELSLPADQTLEATGPAGAVATYSATATDDFDDEVTVDLSPATGTTFPLGTTTVTATATDRAGNTATGSFTISVRDTQAPAITSLSASPSTLWGPNHSLVAVTLSGSASDIADAAPSLRVVGVSSSEPESGLWDGDVGPDWVITGPLSVQLRAERWGEGPGRTYTITIEARDASGNASTGTTTVFVPHNMGK